MNIIKIIPSPSPLASFFCKENDLKLKCKLEWPYLRLGENLDIHERMDTLESRQMTLENEVKNAKSKCITPNSVPGKGRKRVTPTALQVSKFTSNSRTITYVCAIPLNRVGYV